MRTMDLSTIGIVKTQADDLADEDIYADALEDAPDNNNLKSYAKNRNTEPSNVDVNNSYSANVDEASFFIIFEDDKNPEKKISNTKPANPRTPHRYGKDIQEPTYLILVDTKSGDVRKINQKNHENSQIKKK